MMKIKMPTHRKLSIVKAEHGFSSFSRTIDWLIEEKEKRGSFVENDTLIEEETPTATKRNLHDIEYNRK